MGTDCRFRRSDILDQEARPRKILDYFKVQNDKLLLKALLSNRWPLTVALQVGSGFQSWSGDGVFSAANFEGGSDLAGHAVVVAGYDDARGPNGAFLIRNQWGTAWGDNGSIWVDEDFFLQNKEFLVQTFVARRKAHDPDPEDDGLTTPDRVVDGRDLQIWPVSEGPDPNPYPGAPADRSRLMVYKVYNNGTKAVPASLRWGVLLGYYSGYKLPPEGGTQGVLAYDYATDAVGKPGDYGIIGVDGTPLSDFPGLSALIAPSEQYPAGYKDNNRWFHIDLMTRASIAHQYRHLSAARPCEHGQCLHMKYILPQSMTGTFYVKLDADVFRVVHEANTRNNSSVFGDAVGNPVELVNGVIQGAAYNGLTPRRQIDSP